MQTARLNEKRGPLLVAGQLSSLHPINRCSICFVQFARTTLFAQSQPAGQQAVPFCAGPHLSAVPFSVGSHFSAVPFSAGGGFSAVPYSAGARLNALYPLVRGTF